MTASAVKAPRLASVRARVRTRSTEAVVFSTAAVLALAHAFDDALLLPGAGVPLTRHVLALTSRSPPRRSPFSGSSRCGRAHAVTAFTFGVLATVNGSRHAHHVIHEATTASDLTGVLALAPASRSSALPPGYRSATAANAPRAPSNGG